MIWKNLRDTDHVLAMRNGKEDVVLHMAAELTNVLPCHDGQNVQINLGQQQKG
jgi:cold shock CspA family protein